MKGFLIFVAVVVGIILLPVILCVGVPIAICAYFLNALAAYLFGLVGLEFLAEDLYWVYFGITAVIFLCTGWLSDLFDSATSSNPFSGGGSGSSSSNSEYSCKYYENSYSCSCKHPSNSQGECPASGNPGIASRNNLCPRYYNR